MSSEPDVEELVLPGLVKKKDEDEKDKADKVTGQRLKQLNLGEDSDDDSDAVDEEDVSLAWAMCCHKLIFQHIKLPFVM